jgi:hypothetical protein
MKHRGIWILSIITTLLCLWESKGVLNIYLRYGDIRLDYCAFILIGFLAVIFAVKNKPIFIDLFYVFYGMQLITAFGEGYIYKYIAGYGYHLFFYPTPDIEVALSQKSGFGINLIAIVSIIIISRVFKSYKTHNKPIKQD